MPQEIIVLGQLITPKTVREAVEKARAVNWGTHLKAWRYFEITHEGITYERGKMLPTALWHLLKRIYVDTRAFSKSNNLPQVQPM